MIAYEFGLTGAERVDLMTDTAESFYETFVHRRFSGYRLQSPT